MDDPDFSTAAPPIASTTESAVFPAEIPAVMVQAALELWRAHGLQQWLPVTGASMLPVLVAGDQILVSHDIAGLRRGDVVVLRQNDGLIAHRVIRRTRDGAGQPVIWTKGDNNPRFDPPTQEVNVLGRVVAVRRAGQVRSLQTGRSQLAGWSLAAGTDAVAMPYGWLRELKRYWLGSRALGIDPRLVRYAQAVLRRCARIVR